jgi:hypothetical protein
MNSAGLLTVHLCGLEHHRRTTNLDRSLDIDIG